jgi:endonuclease YncB( thermonuclease family)
MIKSTFLAACIALLLTLSPIASAQLNGIVVEVDDGDTVAVRIDERVLHVHLSHVDAPGIGQPYAERAKASLAEMCGEKTVTLDDLGIGRNRQVFGRVECDGVNAGAEQVRRGYAWVFDSGDAVSPLLALQVEAKSQGRGLWGDAAPVPPWEWSDATTRRD